MRLKISVKYSEPEKDVLEIGFYRGKTLLHNVFYDIKGLSENDLFELKCEAVAKFGAVFPEISKKDILKGFSAVDEKMFKLYKETFPAGGVRAGAGRPKGAKKSPDKLSPRTVAYSRRVTPEERDYLDKCLKKYRKS